MKLLFGTAGVPRSAEKQDTLSGLERVKELNLDAMELEFVQGVRMNEQLAREVRKKTEQLGLALTVHAPYFINLNAEEKEKIRASQERIYQSAYIGSLCGAVNVTFHAGFYLSDTAEDTYQTIKKHLAEVLQRLEKSKISIRLTPELTGKPSQFGSLEELIHLAKELPVGFCLDFAHLHSRSVPLMRPCLPAGRDGTRSLRSVQEGRILSDPTGKYNSYPEFCSVLKQIKEQLGDSFLKNMHIHISGIKYSMKGEREHLNLADSDFKYQELLKALKEFEVEGILISESPNLEGDAMLMKKCYMKLQ